MVVIERVFKTDKCFQIIEVDSDNYFKSLDEVYSYLQDGIRNKIKLDLNNLLYNPDENDENNYIFDIKNKKKVKTLIVEIDKCILDNKKPTFLNSKIPDLKYLIKTIDSNKIELKTQYIEWGTELINIQKECNNKSWKFFTDNWEDIKYFLNNYDKFKALEKKEKKKAYDKQRNEKQKELLGIVQLTDQEKAEQHKNRKKLANEKYRNKMKELCDKINANTAEQEVEKFKQMLELRKEKKKIANKKYREKIKQMENELAKLDDDNSI